MDALGGGLKDAKNDKEAGAKTLAVFLGVSTNGKLRIPLKYKLVIIPFEVSTIILSFVPFLIYDFIYSITQIILITLLIIWMVFSTVKLLNMNIFDRKKIKYHNRNHELTGYILVPIILMEYIGIKWVLFLILFPVVWFIVFNYIFYRDSWTNPKIY
jgi:hypothetical protein